MPAEKREGSASVEANSSQEEKRVCKENMTMVQDPQLLTILTAITDGQKESTRRFDSIDGRFSQLSLRKDEQQKDIEFLKKEVSTLKASDVSSSSGTSSGSAGLSVRSNPNEATSLESQYDLPVTKRRVIAVGGFHEEMAPEQLKEIMEQAYTQAGDNAMDWLQEVEAPYKLGMMIKLIMKNSKSMWSLLKAMKGKKFQYARGGTTTQLWHGIDKSPGEKMTSRKLGRAAQATRTHLASKGVEDKGAVR